MRAEAQTHGFDGNIYGKTGTAQRSSENKNVQDGWYMGYCAGPDGPVAFAVRLERGPSSSNAWRLFRDTMLPALKELGYTYK
jgi:beta-lactamase class D